VGIDEAERIHRVEVKLVVGAVDDVDHLGTQAEPTSQLPSRIANAVAVTPQLAHPVLDGMSRSRSYGGD